MIKKILDWILGKSEPVKAAEAPYKVETAPTAEPVVEPTVEVKAEAVVTESVQQVVETAAVTVKAKYKKADLNKMTKAELLALAAKHGVEVKTRAPKADLVKLLAKV